MNKEQHAEWIYTMELQNTNGRESDVEMFRKGIESALEYYEVFGYHFNGRFYKTLDDLRGKTISEENQPIPLYTQLK